jgi:LysR family transcriptional regulator, nitrogen assimilation regulatory protein
MSLRQIQYFVTVARAGSFSAAARLLHVSQPSIWVQIKQLEERLKAKLLLRHARGVHLTEAGQAFFPHAVATLDDIKRGERAVAALNRTSLAEIKLGFTPTAGRALIADLLKKCHQTSPGCRLLSREGFSDELWQLVADGDLDAAFCYDPVPFETLRIINLYREDLYLVGSPSVLKSVGDTVERAHLSSLPLVLGHQHHRTRQFIDAAARESGVKLQSIVEVEPRTLKRELLIHDARCSIVPYGLFLDEVRSGDLVAKPIVPRLSRTVALLVNTRLAEESETFLLTMVRGIVRQRISERELGWRAIN